MGGVPVSGISTSSMQSHFMDVFSTNDFLEEVDVLVT
jgi:hypothetical protein